MAQSEKIRVIVLKSIKYGEADLVLNVLTPQGGKIGCLARGARKSKKRFSGGVLEPTHFIEIVMRPSSRPDGLATIEDAKIIESFDGIRSSYDRLEAALSLLEMADRIAQAGDAESRSLFDLLGNGLKVLQTTSSIERTKVHFILKLLYSQGVLESETWMEIFLKTSLVDMEKIHAIITPQQQRWVLEQMQTYLKTAERS